MSEDLTSRAEAFLFMEGGSLPLRKLGEMLGADKNRLQEILKELSARLKGRGLTLVVTETEAALAVAPEESEALKKTYERELGREIGEAGLEVLAILLYRGASSRAQIDYIRGVNTSWTVRTLLGRGLVERMVNPADGREYLYRPTTELLAHLGAEHTEALPEYAAIKAELAEFERQQNAHQDDHADATE